MMSNFGLSVKSQQQHYIEMPGVEDPYSNAQSQRQDSKRPPKSKSALSNYFEKGNEIDFDEIPSVQLREEF